MDEVVIDIEAEVEARLGDEQSGMAALSTRSASGFGQFRGGGPG